MFQLFHCDVILISIVIFEMYNIAHLKLGAIVLSDDISFKTKINEYTK